MDDKNRDQSMLANPYDLRQHIKFMHAIGCKYTLDDDTNEKLMKLMEAALKGGYKRWREDVEQNGGPSKQ
ncbi:hypothetical protein D8674_030817 [Pyrus ussuriensis x Pyrus communis]|uniref:Uncharacterized protein n=1 Tax=Pyrus ussuriensis x Pyrus communis TaxID=2448454 RepID=A0A5N5EX99_9ROSA|nr:hypothetical protein D8674_030817 [Pyrus ussuriensis x Pyrus communis]